MDLPDLIPARMLNEFAYCPRLAHLEWVHGEWADNSETADGTAKHKRVDRETRALPTPDALAQAAPPPSIHARSVTLSSSRLGAIAKCDLIESDGGKVIPVDYKRGSLPDAQFGPYEPERVQVCLQGLLLRENGYVCDEGAIYYVESKRSIPIPLDAALIARTIELLAELRRSAASGVLPVPLVESPKCPRCSLVGICLPDETNLMRKLEVVDGALVLRSQPAEESATEEPRRLVPARNDAAPVYVQEQGCVVGKSGETLQIKRKGELLAEAKLFETSQVCLFGNIQISTQSLHSLFEWEIPVCFFSYGGYFQGIATGLPGKNIDLRRAQFARASHADACLQVARCFVEGKIRNCRTLLRRNAKKDVEAALDELERHADWAARATSVESLLGIEGNAARTYFGCFASMMKEPEDPARQLRFDFATRNRRPPRDPVSAVLSFLYAMLAKELTVTALAVGLDPYLGFYHRPRFGRPSLALDLMEEFRPLVADSVALSLINQGELNARSFLERGDACSLTPEGRRTTIDAYERRMDSLVSHPVFGYSVSYRRVLEIQTRMLSRALTGEIANYPTFRTR